jgi:hypothetical protein
MLELAYTQNKAAIRQLWDAAIIKEFAINRQKKLDYFGLPGPDIRDLVDWKDHIGFITGVEYSDLKNGRDKDVQIAKISKLMQNLMLLDHSENWEVRKGRLEDIILNGADVDGNKPFKLTLEKNRPSNMYYDIHNWDFQGGLGYSNRKNVDDKVEAIKRCMQLQRGHPFLFLLTLNVRHNLKKEPKEYLLARAREHKELEEILNWYANKSNKRGMDHYCTKALVPLFIRETAHQSSYDCFTYPPLYYQGPSEHLLHFVFLLSPKETILPSFSSQEFSDVVSQPLIRVEKGKFIFPEQHPSFNKNQAVNFLRGHNLPIPK